MKQINIRIKYDPQAGDEIDLDEVALRTAEGFVSSVPSAIDRDVKTEVEVMSGRSVGHYPVRVSSA